MAYVTYQQLEDRLGVVATRQALDEPGNNLDQDIQQYFTRAEATAQLMVDGPLAAIYAVPFDANAQPNGQLYVPPYVVNATLVFLCEMLMQKRLVPGEKNEYKQAADQIRKEIQAIREKGEGLDEQVDRALTPGVAILEPSLLSIGQFSTATSNVPANIFPTPSLAPGATTFPNIPLCPPPNSM